MTVLQTVTPCSLVHVYGRFRGTSIPTVIYLSRNFSKLHGVTAQKTAVFNFLCSLEEYINQLLSYVRGLIVSNYVIVKSECMSNVEENTGVHFILNFHLYEF